MEALTSNVIIFREKGFKEVIKAKGGHKNEALIQQDKHHYKKRNRYRDTRSVRVEKRPCENTVRRQPSTNQEGKELLPEIDSASTLILDVHPQNCE